MPKPPAPTQPERRTAASSACCDLDPPGGGRTVARRRGPRPLPHLDLRVDRHAGAQEVAAVLAFVDADADRQALHDLDEVAGRVLRRQEAEARAGRRGDALDVAAQVA